MTSRAFPDWMCRVPDPSDMRIRELEAALLETNNENAALHKVALGIIGENYHLDQDLAKAFLARWLAELSAQPAGERP